MNTATAIHGFDEITPLPPLSLPLELKPADVKMTEIASRSLQALEKPSSTLANVAFEIMKLGMAKETEIHGRINAHLEEGQKLRGQIQDLLVLSNDLTKMPATAKELSPKAKALIEKLKKEGIELGLDGSISKEKISELKSEVSAQVDRLRSEVNILLSTKVNHLTQVLLPALLEMMKKITQDNREAISRINERMSRG